ncbi:MAG: hypothetical protein WCP97_00110 [bacterium]
MSEQPTTEPKELPPEPTHPIIFHSLANGFLIRIVIIFILLIIAGINADNYFSSKPTLTLASIGIAVLFVAIDGTKSIKQIIKEMEENDKILSAYGSTPEERKKSAAKKIIKEMLEQKYAHSESKTNHYERKTSDNAPLPSSNNTIDKPSQKTQDVGNLLSKQQQPLSPANVLPHNKKAPPLVEQLRERHNEENHG